MSLVIVGSGLGGYLLVKELREQGYSDKVTVVTADDGAFYSKPQISNALAQNKSADDLVNISPEDMRLKYNIELVSNTVVEKINTKEKSINANDKQIPYDKCVLALGAKSVTASWDNLAYKINNLEDYRKFRQVLEPGKVIAIIGSGLVGCELAADLVVAGYKVHLFSIDKEPMARMLPEECGNYLRQQLIASGINWHYIDKFSVSKVKDKLLINSEISADILISALGIKPNTDLAKAAGLDVKYGISVDGYCQTSIQDIYAIGDCASVNQKTLAYVAPIRQCVNVLSKVIMQQSTSEIDYPIMPVILKTPMCRTIFVYSEFGKSWQINREDEGMVAKQFDANSNLCGFVLLGSAAKLRGQLMRECIK